MKFLFIALLSGAFSFQAEAGEIVLSPGSKATISPGELTEVTCSGSVVSCRCVIETGGNGGGPWAVYHVMYGETQLEFGQHYSKPVDALRGCKDWIKANSSLCE